MIIGLNSYYVSYTSEGNNAQNNLIEECDRVGVIWAVRACVDK